MTTPTIPELRYHDRVMSPEPQNLSLAEVVARLREGRVVEVQLEPGDWTRAAEEAPPEYQRISVSVDIAAVKAAYKATGQLPDGFVAERTSSLRIA